MRIWAVFYTSKSGTRPFKHKDPLTLRSIPTLIYPVIYYIYIHPLPPPPHSHRPNHPPDPISPFDCPFDGCSVRSSCLSLFSSEVVEWKPLCPPEQVPKIPANHTRHSAGLKYLHCSAFRRVGPLVRVGPMLLSFVTCTGHRWLCVIRT